MILPQISPFVYVNVQKKFACAPGPCLDAQLDKLEKRDGLIFDLAIGIHFVFL